MISSLLEILNSLVVSAVKLNNWKRPPRKKIIIYDRARTKIIEKYLDKKNYLIFDNRFKNNYSINFYIIFKMIINLNFSLKNYKNIFIDIVSPYFIISMIDYNYGFYRMKKYHPKIIFILIQFAWRRDVKDYILPDKEKNTPTKILNELDYFLVFNKALKKKLKRIIKANYLDFGSFTSNSFKIKKIKNKKYKYLLIGQNTELDLSKKMTEGVKWKDYLSKDYELAKKLALYIKSKGHKLYILGKSYNHTEAINFYNKLIGEKNFIYLPRKGYSYNYLDESEHVFGTTSTMLYEAASRGNKVGIFSVKSKMKKFTNTKFGWPLKVKNRGQFWTNNGSYAEIDRIFNYLSNITNDDWQKIVRSKFNKILKYDMDNSKFKKFSKKINLPLKK